MNLTSGNVVWTNVRKGLESALGFCHEIISPLLPSKIEEYIEEYKIVKTRLNNEQLDFDFQELRNNFIDNYGKDKNGNKKNRDDFRKYALMNSLYTNATENKKVQIIQMMRRKNVVVNEDRWKAFSKAGPSFLNDPVCLVGLYFTIIFVVIIGFEFSLLSYKSMNPTPGPFLHSFWGWGRRWIRI